MYIFITTHSHTYSLFLCQNGFSKGLRGKRGRTGERKEWKRKVWERKDKTCGVPQRRREDQNEEMLRLRLRWLKRGQLEKRRKREREWISHLGLEWLWCFHLAPWLKTPRMPFIHSDTLETLWNSSHHHFYVNAHEHRLFRRQNGVCSNKNCSVMFCYNPVISAKTSRKQKK